MKERETNPVLAELVEPEVEKREVAPGMTVEEIKALFFDEKSLREPPYRVFQLNSDGHRYYYRFDEDGEPHFYPSVTTLLKQVMPTSPQLIDWMIANGKEGAAEKRDLAAAYGTFMHIQFERLLINRRYDFDAVPSALAAYMEENNLPDKFYGDSLSKIRKDVLAFAQFVRDWNVKPLAIEIGLVHPDYHFAGCVDLPCVMTDPKTGEIFKAIIDFKSGRKGFWEEHEIQLHLYKMMWNVNFPESPISRLFNFSPKDWRGAKPTYNLKDQTGSVNAAKIPALLDLAMIEDEKRDNTLTIVKGVLNLDSGKIADNILTLSLSELIKSKAEEKDTPESPAISPEKTEIAEKPKKRGKSEPKEAKPINSPSKSAKPQKEDFSDKLPWEKDMAEGTGIEVVKTNDGVEVSARYFEPAPKQEAKDNLLNDEIEL